MPALFYRNQPPAQHVIRITAKEPVVFVPDNITPTLYQPGEYYSVPEHVKRSMIDRGVAILATPGLIEEPTPAGSDTPEDETARRGRRAK